MVIGLSPSHPQDGYECIFYQERARDSNGGIRLMYIFDPSACVIGDAARYAQQESPGVAATHRPLRMLVWWANRARQEHQSQRRANQGSTSALPAGASEPQARQGDRGRSPLCATVSHMAATEEQGRLWS